MGRPSRFQIMKSKKDEIIFKLTAERKEFFTYTELLEILESNKTRWGLPKKTTVPDFIKFLVSEQIVSYNEFQFPHKTINRYVFGDVTVFKLVSNLFKGAYLSHHTAARFHNLTSTDIGEIFINKEQSDKGVTFGELSQASITKAFSNNMRRSNNFAIHNNSKVYLLNGKHTGDLGVEVDSNTKIRVTSIARTLIDITVRPMYSGGVETIMEIFNNSRGRFSVKELSALLEKMNYTYPYHQSIGFYLERTGYPEDDISIFKNMDIKYDFYLTYKMENPMYNQKWRIYFPKSLNTF